MAHSDVEELYPFTLPATEVTLAVIQLGRCVDALKHAPTYALRQVVLENDTAGDVSVEQVLRIVCRELQNIVFQLDLGENDAA